MTPPPRNPRRQGGQIAVLTVVMVLALLAVLGLVADGGLVFARHRELQATADAAARAGAAQLDDAAYRASDGRIARLDPAHARAAAAQHLRAAGFTGHTEISATAGQVSVRLAEWAALDGGAVLGLGAVSRDQLFLGLTTNLGRAF